MTPTQIVVYSPLEYALYNSSVLIPVLASCVIFLVAFLCTYSALNSRFIRKMLNLSFSSGVPTYGALTIATPIAIGVFLKLV